MSPLDIAIIAVVLGSIAWGIWRGLVREVMSLAGWVIAFLAANLFSAGSHRKQNSNVPRLVRHRHRKHHQNVQSGNESDQPNKNGGDEFLQSKRAEKCAVFLHPGGGRKPLPRGMLHDGGDFSRLFRLGQTEFQNIHNVTCACQRLRRRQGDKAPVFVVIVEARIKDSCYSESPGPRHQPEWRQTTLRTG